MEYIMKCWTCYEVRSENSSHPAWCDANKGATNEGSIWM